MTRRPQFVFGYGSLAVFGHASLAARAGAVPGREIAPAGFIADLAGFVRTWGVAMDNRRDLPGYKYYTDETGRRPSAFVTFLDVRPWDTDGAAVNGLCLPVGEPELVALDRRERNYERVDISDRVAADGARVWAYVGSPEGRGRYDEGRDAGTAVIDATYLRVVDAAFAGLGEAEHRRCHPSLEPGAIPVTELTRHEL
jgi:hypothetical protein